MKRLIISLIVILTRVYAQNPAVVSDKPGWQKISEMIVNVKSGKDAIEIPEAGRFKSLLFKVTQGAIDLGSLEVYYADGTGENIDVNMPLKENEESRVIELNGSEQELRKVIFVYHKLKASSADHAQIELFGMK